MPTFGDASDFLAEVNGEPLTLPLRGHMFVFSGTPSMAQGARLRPLQKQMADQLARRLRGEQVADELAVPDDEEFYDSLLGNQLAPMADAGCTDAEKTHVALTVLMYYLYGSQVAERHWTGALAKMQQADQGEAQPTRTTTATSKATKARPSRGGTPTTRSSRSSKRTSTPSTESGSAK